MQMYSSDHRGYKEDYYSVVEEEYIFKDEYSYNNDSTMHMMKPAADHSLPKHSYNLSHGQVYAGYNNNNNLDKKGHVAQSSGWGGPKNDHYGHHKEGMKHGGYGADQGHYGHHKEGMKHGGYGGEQGHYGHYKEGMNHAGYGGDQGHHREEMKHGGYGAHQGHYGPPHQKVSVWEFKSIVD